MFIYLWREEEMNKTQKIIVTLLIVAIVFSVVSLALNFSLISLKPVGQNSAPADNGGAVSSGGNVALIIEGDGK
ncbi:hypothetical protein AUJ84_04280 [Candidatus Pacearchaeota archaeon CG1_02_32_132]|nr:MAG: hypothetical protein AUJ84_04280 [Candidatus Pacearchaeota archaeon CG1_02_32_132]